MKKWRKYAITGAICIGVAALYCGLRNFPQMPLSEKYRTLCDGFTLPGILCLCVGVLIGVSRVGIFYGLGYCLSVAGKALLPGRREMESYYDYVTRRRRRKPSPACAFLLLNGIACLGLALAFLTAYYLT